MNDTDEIWWRVYEQQYAAPADQYGDVDYHARGPVVVHEQKWYVVRYTPKGVWLRFCSFTTPRFVLKDARKRFACPTLEEAYKSFFARKRKHKSIYRNRIATIEAAECIARRQFEKLKVSA